ncbi:MAG: PD-(D/E)XK nuclease family protein [Candidatus Nanoarchaeia archaeon]|nr:PD-(D/E)XK nuclease family protein [Candidatus Nanoarchaeia archaeon]MDD5357846.1 PD-(D/E)XK nuclease family protein [Candidatus Nanoarchaeia archaeon]MDD5588765.1 PD-(D/E)XK nuclease family protein [Candidatus Nanoarchaeia archaeon]
MVNYSHSKLETFENCRLKFKYRYIDKIVPDIPKSIEAYLGSTVHEALEWLYKKVMEKTIPTITEVIDCYTEKWIQNFIDDFLIVRKEMKAEDYFQRGVEFLINYYLKHQPFTDNTIATEQKIEIDLDGTGDKKIIGYIDRLVHNLEKNEIEIHDYKTSASVLSRDKIENSRQLALYSIAIKERYGKDKNVCMVWHFLAHDMKICINSTNEKLELLRKNVIELINEIEQTKDFPANKTRLCDWCEYRNICEGWK